MRAAQKSDFDRTYTGAEYLELIEQLDRKYELVNGKLVDYRNMAGTSEWHALIAANMTCRLGNALDGTPCRVFSGDLILRVPKTPNYRFGDLAVICGPIERDPDDTFKNKAILNPKLIVEIISPSTRMMDQTVKFDDYIRIESLQEYVLVEQNRAWIQTTTRQPDGTWSAAFHNDPVGKVQLKSLGVELSLAEIYAGVEFPSPAKTSRRHLQAKPWQPVSNDELVRGGIVVLKIVSMKKAQARVFRPGLGILTWTAIAVA